jgi:transmembrane protein EpsG
VTIMWLNLTLVYFFSFFSRYFSMPAPNIPNEVKPNKFLAFLVMVSLVLVAGLQKNIGDTYFYMHSYAINDYSWEEIDWTGDFGFNILQLLLQQISKDPQLLIFIVALLTNVFIVLVLYKYSRMFELAVYVYITSGMFTTSMNGIRQYLAAAIAFLATKYLLNGNFHKYAVVVLIAATIHKTALVLLPIYFIVRREAWTKITFLILLLSVFIVLGFNTFTQFLFAALDSTQYGHYSNFTEGGASKMRILVNAAPVVIAYFAKDKLRELWPKSDYIVNMAVISMLFIIIASQNWIFARFNIYFGLYNLILISWVVKLFIESNQKVVYYGILVCYLLYFYYEHVISFGLIYRSDYLK